MKTYTASIQNTEDSIRRLMKQHYLAFNKKVLALQIVLCVGCFSSCTKGVHLTDQFRFAVRGPN